MARKKQSLEGGALILIASSIIVKIIGVLYKIPIRDAIGVTGSGYYDIAYNVYIPIYSIALAGMPVAISKLVSHYAALGRFRDVRRVKKVATMLFSVTGIVGTALIFLIAYPYTSMKWALSINTPEALPSMLVIAPSVFVCCMMAAYRGYYNGLRNMYPTAISEIIEAAGKAIIGVMFSRGVINYAVKRFEAGQTVFGETVADRSAAVKACLPYATAAAIAGVTIATMLTLGFLYLRHKKIGDKITAEELRASPRPDSPNMIARNLLAIAIPVVTGTLIFSITNFLDSWIVLNRLSSVTGANADIIRNMFHLSGVEAGDLKDLIYGAFTYSLDFRTLLPTLTMTLGVSVIPVLTEAMTLNLRSNIKRSIESVIKLTMMIALPAGFGLAALAEPILRLMYGGKADFVATLSISVPSLVSYGLMAFLLSSSQPMSSILQGLGRPDLPLLSTTIGVSLKILFNFVLIGIPQINIFGVIAGTFVCYGTIVLLNYINIVRISKVKIDLKKIFFKPLLSAAASGIAAYSIYGICSKIIPAGDVSGRINGNAFSALIAIGAAVLVYAIALLFSRTISRNEILLLPKGEKISKTLEKYGLIS